MSWSSGSSSAPGFRVAAGRRGATERRSPVPYRESPMAYDGEVLCNCNPRKKAPRWISWSAQNPGRRYYSCVDAKNGHGCGFVEWHDDPIPKFWSDLIGDLRDVVWRMQGEQRVATEEDAGPEAKIKALQEEVEAKKLEIAKLKGKYESIVMLFVVFVVGLVAGKLCFQ